jgi:hypothetical protein
MILKEIAVFSACHPRKAEFKYRLADVFTANPKR